MAEKEPDKKPWFGNKRVGVGFRPQTWQGWLITIVGAIVLVVVIWFIKKR